MAVQTLGLNLPKSSVFSLEKLGITFFFLVIFAMLPGFATCVNIVATTKTMLHLKQVSNILLC